MRATLRYKFEKRTFDWLKRHHTFVAAQQLTNKALLQEGNHLALVAKAWKEKADEAIFDAGVLYMHHADLAEVIRRYQQNLKTLQAPDPQEALVQMLVDNYDAQYKDTYEWQSWKTPKSSTNWTSTSTSSTT